jgi:hypothetical protein
MGDHTPREMTISVLERDRTRLIGQHCLLHHTDHGVASLSSSGYFSLLLAAVLSCAPAVQTDPTPSKPPSPSPEDTTKPQVDTTKPGSPLVTRWITNYATGPATYRLTDTTILVDPSTTPETRRHSTRFVTYDLLVELRDTIVSAQGSIREGTDIATAFQVRAQRSTSVFQIDTTGIACTVGKTSSTFSANLADILPAGIHKSVDVGASWTHSLRFTSCLETIPVRVVLHSKYVVKAHTTRAGRNLVHIQRNDSLSAQGTGASGPHHASVAARGQVTSNIYFDPERGRTTEGNSIQEIVWTIIASNQTRTIRQHSTQTLRLHQN